MYIIGVMDYVFYNYEYTLSTGGNMDVFGFHVWNRRTCANESHKQDGMGPLKLVPTLTDQLLYATYKLKIKILYK